jgi:hypothetical protein
MHIILKQIYYKIKRNSNKISSETNISKKIAQNKIHQEAAASPKICSILYLVHPTLRLLHEAAASPKICSIQRLVHPPLCLAQGQIQKPDF